MQKNGTSSKLSREGGLKDELWCGHNLDFDCVKYNLFRVEQIKKT